MTLKPLCRLLHPGWLTLVAPAILALAAPAAPIHSQVPVHLEVTPQVGYFFFDHRNDTSYVVNESGVLYQVRVGLLFPGDWGLEASGGFVPSNLRDGEATRRVHSYFLAGAGTYHFLNPSPLIPFVTVGAEMLNLTTSVTDDQTNLSLVWGGGLELAVSPQASVRLDGRHHYSSLSDAPGPAEPDDWLSNFELAAGLSWKPWK